jgi:Rrf2 family iron-sulfur cluster assembly transcriptional regulator
MEITRATEYAVRCVLHLALAEGGRVVPRREIAVRWDVPEQFLGKIAQRLARAGILQILQGARGGYRLLVPPGKLTLLAVVEAAEGSIILNQCLVHPGVCSRTRSCVAHRVWSTARRQLRETLGSVTFAELAAAEQSSRVPRPPARRRHRTTEGR